MEHKQLLEAIAPVWDEEHNGVYIPILDCVLQLKNLSENEVTWHKAMKLAKYAGGRLFTKDEANILLWHKDAINDILKEHGGDPLASYFWSSSEYNEGNAWYVNFSSGNVSNGIKYSSYVARAVVAFNH